VALPQHGAELVEGEPDPESRNRFELVEGAAGVAQPRPEIIGTYTSQAAARGARTSESCPHAARRMLVDLGSGQVAEVEHLAVRIIDSVSATVSAAVMPLKNTAMARAEAW